MLTTLLALGGSALSSGIGSLIAGRKQKKAAKEQRKILNQMSEDNETNFLSDYYQDVFDDPTSRTYLKRISEDLYDRNKGLENNGISTGATHENMQARKDTANRAMGDAVNNVVVNGENRKRAAKDQYIRRKDAIASGNVNLAQQQGEMQSQNWTTLGSNLADSITGLASTYVQAGGKLFGNNPIKS